MVAEATNLSGTTDLKRVVEGKLTLLVFAYCLGLVVGLALLGKGLVVAGVIVFMHAVAGLVLLISARSRGSAVDAPRVGGPIAGVVKAVLPPTVGALLWHLPSAGWCSRLW